MFECFDSEAWSALLSPVDPSFRAPSGRLKFTARLHKFNKDSLSPHAGDGVDTAVGAIGALQLVGGGAAALPQPSGGESPAPDGGGWLGPRQGGAQGGAAAAGTLRPTP